MLEKKLREWINLQEIIMGLVMTLDVVTLYLLLPNIKQKFFLSFWTSFFHMLFPLIGFSIGQFIVHILLQWSYIISSIFLFFFGLNVLLNKKDNEVIQIPFIFLAMYTSLDAFSVSVSFGMLNLTWYLFIISSGICAFLFSYLALFIAGKSISFKGGLFRWVAGLSLIAISLYTLFQQ